MPPASAIFYPTDGRLSDPMRKGNDHLRARVGSNRYDLRIGQLRKAVPLAGLARVMPELVGVVPFRGVPAKVLGQAVQAVAVVVGALHSGWARAKKCVGYKQVNVHTFFLPVMPKAYRQVTPLFADVRREDFCSHRARPSATGLAGSGFTANAPKAADREQPNETNHGAPLFMSIFHASHYALTMRQSRHATAQKGGC